MSYKKKLIEVALPLEEVNRESAREKSIRHGHPSTLHLWWSRKPLAACRAVLFAQLVDDPSSHLDRFPTKEAQDAERERLFALVRELVKWENTSNEEILRQAREEIRRSTGGDPPPVLDPFCGGGSIPLEAQRLGLEAHASDLNPVAVLITKGLIEIPPRFAGRPPVHPQEGQEQPLLQQWRGAQGLAEDIRYYGRWMRDRAWERIGHLYPEVELPPEQGGGRATVIAWLWARTVPSPNPAVGGAYVPLVNSFWLSKRDGRKAWVKPIIDRANNTYRFEVQTGSGSPPPGTVARRGGRCLLTGAPMPFSYIRSEAQAGRMRTNLMAIVAAGPNGRVYQTAPHEHEEVTELAKPTWTPKTELEGKTAVNVPLYGLKYHCDLFTPRQLVALTTFSALVEEAHEQAQRDAVAAGLTNDRHSLADGGTGATAYADAVAIYLGFGVNRLADRSSTICSWDITRDNIRNTFSRQAIQMTWDFAEGNPFSNSTGSFLGAIEWIARTADLLPALRGATATQAEASQALFGSRDCIISTDPPYYDNISYAELSDFFYVWLRRTLKGFYPNVFRTLLTPKDPELVATPYRFDGDKQTAKQHFEQSLYHAFRAMRGVQRSNQVTTLFYAFKQTESQSDASGVMAVASTGWETMLQALTDSGFVITATWPVRTELANRSLAQGTNALASSIVLACRPRPDDAPLSWLQDFLADLRRELPPAMQQLQQSSIAPVDLAQAAIGPGMAVFSRHRQVLESDGTPMSVRTALELINQVLDEHLAQREGDYDSDTRWALAWFEQHGFKLGPYGLAETLCKAKNTSTEGLVQAGLVTAHGGKVRLRAIDDLAADWDPSRDSRLTVWETTHHLVQALLSQGETGAAEILSQVDSLAEAARDLAYRLYTICDRQGWAAAALGYNSLVASWPEITDLAKAAGKARIEQGTLL